MSIPQLTHSLEAEGLEDGSCTGGQEDADQEADARDWGLRGPQERENQETRAGDHEEGCMCQSR